MDIPLRHLGDQIKMGEYRWWNPGIKGLGGVQVKVVGIASTGAPLIGRTYIVELPAWSKLVSEYDYTHMAAFECHLHEEAPNNHKAEEYLECPWCGYRRHRIRSEYVMNPTDITLKCGNSKCGKTGIITMETWEKIEGKQ